MAPPVTAHGVVSWPAYGAVLFDLDGVLTPTAELHQLAWSSMFEQFLDQFLGPDHDPYTEDDYLAYVDGKPRFDGVRSFLASRGIQLPEGDPDAPPGTGSVSALGNRKNELFQQLLRTQGIAPYPGSLRLLDHLDALRIPMAVVSSSRNAREVLEGARLTDRFAVVADGVLAAERGLPGKPAPDLFLAAADKLTVAPAAAVVVEDAVSGVAAGRAGGFGLVIGVDRGAGPEALQANGADLVVDDLGLLVPDEERLDS
jgi:beta-phosphoglucomutase family hydrolase